MRQGPEVLGVHAHRHDRHALVRHAHVAGDVAPRRLGDGDDPRHLAGDAALHAQEPEPAAQRDLAEGPLGPRVLGQLQAAVDGDRVVQGLHDRPAVVEQAEDAVAEALVVVDDVEVLAAGVEDLADPAAERAGLGEAGRAHDGELEDVDRRAELAQVGDVEGVVGPVEVEAGDLHQRHVGGEVGVGLAAEDLDVMAHGRQLAAQMVRVDTLATRMRVAAVDEQGNAKEVPHRKRSACRGIDRSVKRGPYLDAKKRPVGGPGAPSDGLLRRRWRWR